MKNQELIPSTAQAATGVILEQYEEMVKKGYDELLVISISQKLSGTYEGCMLAAKMLDDVKVTVFDSRTLSYPQAKMALDASKMIQDGKSLEEVLKRLEYIRDNSMIWFTVETLRYLVKNGRLSGASGFVGSWLTSTLLYASKALDIDLKVTAIVRDVSKLGSRIPRDYSKQGHS